MKKKCERRYVFGTRAGHELGSSLPQVIGIVLAARQMEDDYWRKAYPVAYELVPVPLRELRRRAKERRKA